MIIIKSDQIESNMKFNQINYFSCIYFCNLLYNFSRHINLFKKITSTKSSMKFIYLNISIIYLKR